MPNSLHTKIKKLNGKTSHEIKKVVINKLSKSNFCLKTLTFDNDKAFTELQEEGNKLKADSYFTRPYTSQDKGDRCNQKVLS